MLRPDQQEIVMGITGSKTIDATWAEIESLLVSRLAAVEREIRQYPAPIPACDAQFNHLLDERSAIPQEMVRAGIAAEVSKSLPERQRALDEFIAASAYVDGIKLNPANEAAD
jgi:hypothetical protein